MSDAEVIWTVEHDGVTIAERDTREEAIEYVERQPGASGGGNHFGVYEITKWRGHPWEDRADWEEVQSGRVRSVRP